MNSYQLPSVVPAEIFRAYDIRGEAGPDGVSVPLAYGLGLAVATELQAIGQTDLVVGRDARLSGPALTDALIAGLLAGGCDVVDLGEVPTPLVYFATHYLAQTSGVMVTASHNPGHHNGFKIVLDRKTMSTDGVQGLYQRLLARDVVVSAQPGTRSTYDIVPEYLAYVIDTVAVKRGLKVVVDCGNGIAGRIAPLLYERLGVEVIPLFCEVDGHFPNHHPDPTVLDNLVDLQAAVLAHEADFGVAFDGDADRLGMVDERGEVIWPDRQLMLFAKDVLSRHPGASIVFDVKCSAYLPAVIAAEGGEPIMYRTGHSLIKAKMRAVDAILAGEMSGHIFFKEDWFGFDDGLYVGARMLSIIASQTEPVSQVFAHFPNGINTPEIKVPIDESRKAEVMVQLPQTGCFEGMSIETMDGLRVSDASGWGLVRPSNTSPYLTLRFEADSEAALAVIQARFRKALSAVMPGGLLPF